MKQVTIAFLVAMLFGAAHAQPVGVEMSPAVTWDPYNEVRQTTAAGSLTAADVKLARERAARMFEVVKLVPSFNRPTDRTTLMTSKVRKDSGAVVNQSFTPYWSSPSSVRRGKDGVLMPVLGGVHSLLYFQTNVAPDGGKLMDGATRDGRSALVPAPIGTLLQIEVARLTKLADSHLAALAIEHGATLASFDRDFDRFEGLDFERLRA